MADNRLFQQLKAIFAALPLPVAADEDHQVVVTALPTEIGLHALAVRAHAEAAAVEFRLGFLAQVPEARRAAVAQAAAHVDCELLLGAFYVDLRDGELGFCVTLPCGEAGINEQHVLCYLATAAGSLQRHLPALNRLCWGGESVEEVLGLPLPDPAERLMRALGQEGTAE